MEKIKQQRVIIYCKELLTGNELVQVIKEYKLENYLIEKIDQRNVYDSIDYRPECLGFRKAIDKEYLYVFVDKEVKNENNTKRKI